MGAHFLDRLFAPEAIAVFGASKRPESVGTRVFDNLRSGGFTGPIYAVNPKYSRLYHQPCYPSITAISEHIDLAVIATPALVDSLTGLQFGLIVAGGLAYTIGFPVLVTRRPDPWPTTFGYHEVWHLLTVVAAALHFAAVANVLA